MHPIIQFLHALLGGHNPAPAKQIPAHPIQQILSQQTGHQLVPATPDINVGAPSPYVPLNRGISFGNPRADPNVGGVPFLQVPNSMPNDWQFYSNSPNSNAPGWLENGNNQRIPFGGSASTYDAPVSKGNISHPSVALPQYVNPKLQAMQQAYRSII